MGTVKGPDRNPEEELTRMVKEYQLGLLRLCFAYLHDKTLAEDAVQETFLKAFRSIDGFKGESAEKTWLSSIAINCCRDMRRSAWFRHVDGSVSLDSLPEPSVKPTEYDNALTLEVMRLPVCLREVILLYYFEHMTTFEIGKTLKITQSAVSNRLKRARAKLKKALGEEYERGEEYE